MNDSLTVNTLVMKILKQLKELTLWLHSPAEGREIMLNVRIATPPWDRAMDGWM
jgi:Na+-transporting NADH:ubiquinone oxidoreductase subunit F